MNDSPPVACPACGYRRCSADLEPCSHCPKCFFEYGAGAAAAEIARARVERPSSAGGFWSSFAWFAAFLAALVYVGDTGLSVVLLAPVLTQGLWAAVYPAGICAFALWAMRAPVRERFRSRFPTPWVRMLVLPILVLGGPASGVYAAQLAVASVIYHVNTQPHEESARFMAAWDSGRRGWDVVEVILTRTGEKERLGALSLDYPAGLNAGDDIVLHGRRSWWGFAVDNIERGDDE